MTETMADRRDRDEIDALHTHDPEAYMAELGYKRGEDGKLYKQLPVIEPQHDTAEHKKAMLNEREKAMALFMRGKYKEVVELVDSIYGWAPGELEGEFGHPREYTKESALKAMQSL